MPMPLDIVQIPAGPIATNAYVVVDPDTREALIIDAPPEADALVADALTQRGARAMALVLTHSHWDHIGDVAAIKRRHGVPVLMHDLDRGRLETPGETPTPIEAATPDQLLADGDSVTLGSHTFAVLYTPGHSPGQISLYSAADALMFGGDTLFPNGYGTVEIPGASESDTVATIRRLLELPDAVTVYTGHGEPTTIGRERHWMQRVAVTGQLL
jgi:hydroxyacylglutathione hydrolase